MNILRSTVKEIYYTFQGQILYAVLVLCVCDNCNCNLYVLGMLQGMYMHLHCAFNNV